MAGMRPGLVISGGRDVDDDLAGLLRVGVAQLPPMGRHCLGRPCGVATAGLETWERVGGVPAIGLVLVNG